MIFCPGVIFEAVLIGPLTVSHGPILRSGRVMLTWSVEVISRSCHGNIVQGHI